MALSAEDKLHANQLKLASCLVAGNVAATAANVRNLRGEKGKALLSTGGGKKALFGALDSVCPNHHSAPFWGEVRKALEAPVPSGPANPMEAAFAASPTPPSAVDLSPAKPAKKTTKKGSKKTTKKVDRSAPVYRAAHLAAKKVQAEVGGGASLYKECYNRYLINAGVTPYYEVS